MKKGTVYALCGKIASGKSTYARQMMETSPALSLSCDELVRRIMPGDLGDAHDATLARVKDYLLRKAREAADCGVDVILDWGFWAREDRSAVRAYFADRGIPVKLYGIRISDEDWHANIRERNAAILAGENQIDYFVDDGLLSKLASLYEEPEEGELDLLVKISREKA